MNNLSNKITPIFNKIFGGQVGTNSADSSTISISTAESDLQPMDSGPLAKARSGTRAGRHAPSRYYRQLGKLDPALYLSEETEELYDITASHLGRIWFSVSYLKANELLKVTIHKARNLRQSRTFGQGTMLIPDPAQSQHLPHNLGGIQTGDDFYSQDVRIKVFIEQAEKKHHMTATKKQTANPNYNEQFCFQVAPHGLGQQTLRLQVLGIDRRRRCKLISYSTFSLAPLEKTVEDGRELRVFRDLQPVTESEFSGNPRLLVALTFFPQTERLIVGLFECRNLPLNDNGLPVDVYAKVVVFHGLQGRESRTKRTESLGTKDSFDESFVFHKITDASNINVRITLVQHGFIDRQLGFVVLGGELVSKGHGIQQWKTMLEKPDEQVCEWQDIQLL